MDGLQPPGDHFRPRPGLTPDTWQVPVPTEARTSSREGRGARVACLVRRSHDRRTPSGFESVPVSPASQVPGAWADGGPCGPRLSRLRLHPRRSLAALRGPTQAPRQGLPPVEATIRNRLLQGTLRPNSAHNRLAIPVNSPGGRRGRYPPGGRAPPLSPERGYQPPGPPPHRRRGSDRRRRRR